MLLDCALDADLAAERLAVPEQRGDGVLGEVRGLCATRSSCTSQRNRRRGGEAAPSARSARPSARRGGEGDRVGLGHDRSGLVEPASNCAKGSGSQPSTSGAPSARSRDLRQLPVGRRREIERARTGRETAGRGPRRRSSPRCRCTSTSVGRCAARPNSSASCSTPRAQRGVRRDAAREGDARAPRSARARGAAFAAAAQQSGRLEGGRDVVEGEVVAAARSRARRPS